MSLKYKANTKDEIPPEHQSLYVERDGVWMLDLDGVVDESDFHELSPTEVPLLNQPQMGVFLCPALLPVSPLANSVTSAGTSASSRLSA